MTQSYNPDAVAIHGKFTDEDERVAYGLYQRPIPADPVAKRTRQVCGDDSPVTDTIRNPPTTKNLNKELKSIVRNHPVWSVETPETIIRMEIGQV